MESIKDKVAIIGMGCTKFGELWDKDVEDLAIEAAYEAYEDAGIGPEDIQACWVGTAFWSTGMMASVPLKLDYIPVTRVENVCATGMESVRNAAYGVASKAFDVVLALGVEKLKDVGFGGMAEGTGAGGSDKWHPVYGSGIAGPGRYALAATRYFHRFGLSGDEGKRLLAKISVKSHYNGSLNPRAHLRRRVTEEQVLNAPLIAWPLGLFDSCGVTDGASAAILCRTEDARKFRDDYVTIKGMGLSVGTGMGKVLREYDWSHWEETVRASRMAYEQAGIKDPRKELDMAEVHDCFSIAELMCYEDLGFCEKGKAKYDIEAGSFALTGDMPVNVGGGLKSFGHPVGASGAREIFEIYQEIQGKAQLPERQLKDVKMGLAHSQGGHPGKFLCAVSIIGAP